MYPIPGGLAVNANGHFLKIHTRFSIGAGMVSKNSFELLLHRNIPNDDYCGLPDGMKDFSTFEHKFDLEVGDLD